ncbi:MAG: hypothetical protein ACUVTZ_02665 [Armatimonadota bacterium]
MSHAQPSIHVVVGGAEMSVFLVVLAILGRPVFRGGVAVIVGHAAITSYCQGNFGMLALELAFFPFTYFIWPFYAGLWRVLLISLAGYVISTTCGMPEVR